MFDDITARPGARALERHAAGQRSQKRLPTFYYLDNFKELRSFVERHYCGVLSRAARETLDAFDALDKPAQCLYVRLWNRKGHVFETSKLKYPELGSIDALADCLRRTGFARGVSEQDYEHVLHALPKAVIIDCLRDPAIKRAWHKADCVRYALEHVSASRFIALARKRSLVVLERSDTFCLLQYLYFGRLFDGASQITLRDLGIVKMPGGEAFEPRFATTEEASNAFFFANERRCVDTGMQTQINAAIERAHRWPVADSDVALAARDKLALDLGRLLEHRGETKPAIAMYQKADSVACLRSAVRLLISQQQHASAKAYLQNHVLHPVSDDAQRYALDTLESRFGEKPRSDTRSALIEASVIQVDAYWQGSPERAAVNYYAAQGIEAHRSENQLWRTLFGLLFWDLLFDGHRAKRHSPFDGIPAQLSNKTFYAAHTSDIEQRLTMHGGVAPVLRRILHTATQNYGQHNGVFRWRRNCLSALRGLLEASPPSAIAKVLRRLCEDYPRYKTGYPDLFLIEAGVAKFVEIKAPGDQLRRHQLQRIGELRDAGFATDVVRIEWQPNPDQIYVVVDVETTGGKAATHRVTEIGAVKMQRGKIIDRFSTLVNPMRPIPAHIVRLTGITDAMVADAPRFSDIGGPFSEFLAGAIFVAHNVNFDYGFLKAEYERVGERFRYPKLCTCASMRRLYKGHKSYSLKALCRDHDIRLDTHHRALCDAEAAAELLLLIQAAG